MSEKALLQKAVAVAIDRIAELELDAARYRWLRTGRDDQEVCAMKPTLDSWQNWKDVPLFEEELDAAIDKAMKEAK